MPKDKSGKDKDKKGKKGKKRQDVAEREMIEDEATTQAGDEAESEDPAEGGSPAEPGDATGPAPGAPSGPHPGDDAPPPSNTASAAEPVAVAPDQPAPATSPDAWPSAPPVQPTARGGRAITVEDLANIAVVGEPAFSPDGRTVAVAVTTPDLDEDTYRAAIWLVPTAPGEEPRQLTSGQKRDGNPRFSPDGSRLLFLSNRDTEAPQLWVIPVGGGEARRVTNIETGAGEPAWAPDGRRVAFVAKVAPEDPNPDSDVKVIRDVRYKFDGEGFLGGKRRQLFVVDVDRPGAEPEQVTSGDFEHREPAWSPSGREIAFTSNRDPEWQYQRGSDIWTVVPGTGAAPKRLTPGDGAFSAPSYSPDGRTVAALGHRQLDLEAPNDELWLVPAGGGDMRSLTPDHDRSISDVTTGDIGTFPGQRPAWTPDGSAILVNIASEGECHVHRVSVTETGPGQITKVTEGARRVGAFALDPSVPDGGRLAISVSDPVTPFEVHLVSAGQPERPLTRFNEAFNREVAVSLPEPFWVESAGGVHVEGWLMRPSGPATAPGVKHPAVLEIHGGPHMMYGLGFHHEFQVLAGRGYAVVFANPRGSTGYGEPFAQGLHAAWGENDFPDQMAVVDRAIELGNLDPNRLGVAGGSYGGFMTNWIIGHTDRFRAAVTQRTISNMYSMYGTDDIAIVSLDQELGGPPWGSPELTRRYLELSPITYVNDMTTPLLILHAEEDHRCPMEQAEQLYLALKRLRREVELVRFPDESHGLTRGGKPKHRAEHMRRLVGWFDGHM